MAREKLGSGWRWLALLPVLCLCAPAAHAEAAALKNVQHIVVLYMENRSFDNLYGLFPGANGISNAGGAGIQVNSIGLPYQDLPPVLDASGHPDTRFSDSIDNGPFDLDRYMPTSERTADLVHRFYQEQMEIDGGRMDRFAELSGAGGLAMGYYDGSHLPLWAYAQTYTLADHFFHAAYGGSFLNHMWLVCACTPKFPNAPADMVASVDASGAMVKDGAVTPDGYAVNTIEPSATPHPAGIPADHLLPLLDDRTIGDSLSEKGISWAWYAGGYRNAVAGHPDKLFEYHHQPFLYFRNYAEGTPGRAAHLKDEADFLKAIDDNKLPQVAFWKPLGDVDGHPGYSDILDSEKHLADIISRIQHSLAWTSTVIVVTYDESGGWWDHVAPPPVDRWGEGVRVPTIVIAPYAKPKTVDSTMYDTTSILKMIEEKFDLAPLGPRDAKANSLSNTLHLEGNYYSNSDAAPVVTSPVDPSSSSAPSPSAPRRPSR